MNRDEMFLRHILDQISFLREQFLGVGPENLMEDPLLQKTCLRSFEVMGESINSVSEDFKDNHSDIDWNKIMGLMEKYINIDNGVQWDLMWNFIKTGLPEVEQEIEKDLNK
ncbi:HepT-like ribonuclease domain-containing protein [Methanobacterium paludis]|uniref:DUF86 domain-containing protein n=1 Tax=Methanobacterium paludis (strain DSM 25820 / JCM 18151 / SWAN1) TaxID=868131 RepID=F6D7G2_METPW|nr:HepT-like ribonuclease domain-containing protein [Methanobacterium paludis]AEG17744.1 protein of unknown function DUF86 [Methanobacterium paludis]